MDRPSYVHRGGPTPLIGSTVDAFTSEVAQRFATLDAVISLPQRERLSYADLEARVDVMARGLIGLGVGRGDRVGVWSTNNAEWVILQWATARVGAVLVNVNPAYRVSELRHALQLARLQVLFTIPSFRSSHYVDMLCEVLPALRHGSLGDPASADLPDLRHVVVWDPAGPEHTARPAPGLSTWQEVLQCGESVSTAQVDERRSLLDADDPINIQFTSGTTGLPKAVVLTHHNILNNAYFVAETMELGPKDRLCVPVPFYHCFGMVVANLGCLTHGAAIVIPAPHFDAEATLAAIETERCTAVHGVPTMFIEELEHPHFGHYDLSSLRTGIMAGAPCPAQLVRRVQEEMGCRGILIGYGETEASPVTNLTRLDDTVERRAETVGTNLPHQEVKIVDPATGRVQPLDEPGEVCFRGYHVMRGYYGQDDATHEAIDEAGWLHSGDVGVLDEDGYLRITGRIKNMIIRGGENLYPAEIEAFFFGHPKIAQIAVFGVPDPEMGEEVGAWVQLHEGEHADPDELRAWAKGRISHHKIPRHIWIVDEFPMTVTGKIQKFRIREIVEDWMRAREAEETAAP